ncbi:hypothetical protein [Natronorubrum daqingense]|uniref:Uncharacterized protein n=1 Tax=Natronorubrum daqingense TaxID=588898 RepID=A0A1N7E6R4_9EURY|nr:hypothetical protein [Natronorubrum daqingense]SIR83767.1 hypothetical protein SAMN05421809_2497 [Natronorubrum daqingense]
MAYELHCDSCHLERECADWIEASSDANDHEAAYPDHWVTIVALE